HRAAVALGTPAARESLSRRRPRDDPSAGRTASGRRRSLPTSQFLLLVGRSAGINPRGTLPYAGQRAPSSPRPSAPRWHGPECRPFRPRRGSIGKTSGKASALLPSRPPSLGSTALTAARERRHQERRTEPNRKPPGCEEQREGRWAAMSLTC